MVLPRLDNAFRIILTGDVMTGRGIDRVMKWPLPAAAPELSAREARRQLREAERANGSIPMRVEPGYVWGDALFAMNRLGASLRLANLATAVTDAVTAWPAKKTHLRMNPRHVDCLTAAGFTGCSLANDHVLDWDYPGLRDTLASLRAATIASAGAGLDAASAHAPAVFELGPHSRLLLFAWATPGAGLPAGWAASRTRPGIALLPGLGDADLRDVEANVQANRRAGDIVVVSLHWGEREARRVPDAHLAFAHRLVDSGLADIIHGHGPRLPLPVEVYRGRLILQACGDFLNDEEAMPAPEGARVDIGALFAPTLAPDGQLRMLDVLPWRRRRFRLERADDDGKVWLAGRLSPLGGPPARWIEAAAGDTWRLDPGS